MGSFENEMIRSLDSRSYNERENPVIEKMYPKAHEMLRNESINPYSSDLPKTEVARDMAYIDNIKSKFTHENIDHVATVFEAIMFEHIELSEWLGHNVRTIRTSEYDDIINGVDLIIEFTEPEEKKHFALAIDVTFGTQSIGRKLRRIKNEIDTDTLTRVKYSESGKSADKLDHIPRLVIGAEKNTVIELAGLWMNQKKKELGGHFVRDIILQEIYLQLKTFLEYANAQPESRSHAAKAYSDALATVVSILRESRKETTKENQAALKNDRVFRDIQDSLSIFKSPSYSRN